MQHCIVCGSELPDNARFCGKCGHVISDTDIIDKDTTNENTLSTADTPGTSMDASAASIEPGQQPADLAELNTQELHHEHEHNGRQPVDLAELNTQQLVPAHAHADVKQSDAADMPTLSTTSTTTTAASPAPETPQPAIALPTAPPAKAKRGSTMRRTVIGLVILVVLLAAAGIFLWVQNLQANTPVTVKTPPLNPPVTRVVPTPTISATASASLTFSGGVTGTMTGTTLARCGALPVGNEYDLYVNGAVNGQQYTFALRLISYTNPGSFNTGKVFVVFSQQPLTPTTVWGNTGNQPATVTVNSDGKSGSLDLTLAGTTSSVHATGNWSCP